MAGEEEGLPLPTRVQFIDRNCSNFVASFLPHITHLHWHTFSDLYSECTQRTASSILMTQRTAAAGSNCVFDSPSGSNPIYMLRERARLRATFNLCNSLEIIYNIFAVPCASYRFPLPASSASSLEGRFTLRIRISGNAKSPFSLLLIKCDLWQRNSVCFWP